MIDNSAMRAPQPLGQIQAFLVRHPVVLQAMRFAAIGVINTALDFIVLNYISKQFNIAAGGKLGLINMISFGLAMVQSYGWNKSWAFGDSKSSPLTNFYRLLLVGGLGTVSVVAVLAGASQAVSAPFYLEILGVFVLCELLFWYFFGLYQAKGSQAITHQFGAFILVSFIGLVINSLIVSYVSGYLQAHPVASLPTDTLKNIAKILATLVSLFWNFFGYKLVVFKK